MDVTERGPRRWAIWLGAHGELIALLGLLGLGWVFLWVYLPQS